MLLLQLLAICSCSVTADLSDSVENNPSCLLQTDQHRPRSKTSHLQEAVESNTASVHPYADDLRLADAEFPDSTGFTETHAGDSRPNGPADMRKTSMKRDKLPEDATHIHKETVTSDWADEYPPFTRSTRKSDVDIFTRSTEWAAPVAAAVSPWQQIKGWPWQQIQVWLLVLLILLCLLFCCCALLFKFGRSAKHQESHVARHATITSAYAPHHHAFVAAHDEVRPAFEPTTIKHAHTAPTHFATVGVDTDGDGRANYLYTGIDRDRDGVPDSLQAPRTASSHMATVGVDTSGDGRANYRYTGLDRDGDGIPDALQSPYTTSAHITDRKSVV